MNESTTTGTASAVNIILIDNSGSGRSGPAQVPALTTFGDLFKKHHPDGKYADFVVRLTRPSANLAKVRAAEHEVILEGDRVTISPTKQAGASA